LKKLSTDDTLIVYLASNYSIIEVEKENESMLGLASH
jgi:hypothetical protein